ncbi:THAP domain-containing protein 1-like isoform X2 [Linepithema humile]|uniref:THAP domain-containing protein 1-like isoform X2 n=1 Tax=Linepithema humile TaxID=83485 RepID=UPI00351E397C
MFTRIKFWIVWQLNKIFAVLLKIGKMPLCAAIGCRNKSYRKSREQINVEENLEITFHKFPKEKTKKLAWAEAMGLRVEYLPKSAYLCSLHFLEADFDRTSVTCTRLREFAIPHSSTLHDKIEDHETNKNNEAMESELPVEMSFETTENNEAIESELPMEMSFGTSVVNDELALESESEIQTCHMEECERDTKELEDTPRKKLLRKTLVNQRKFYQRQVRTLKQKNKRQEERITKLNTILKELKQKSLLTDEHADLLKTIHLVSSSGYEGKNIYFS